MKHPNVTSDQEGNKYNKSYVKYFGFGIINKYRNQDGLSFGTFQGKKVKYIPLEEDICSKLHSQFMIIIPNSIMKLKKHKLHPPTLEEEVTTTCVL